MGRHRIKPMSYEQITAQAEKTVTLLMKPAHVKTNPEATKAQCVSRALGAVVLWEDLTSSYTNTEADKNRLYALLNCEGVQEFTLWLEENMHTASFDEIAERFKVAFPGNIETSNQQLRGILLATHHLPLFGRTE